MAIHFITGKPRAGKGMLTMNFMVDTLVKTKRPIVTNFSIEKMPWVNEKGVAQSGLLAYLRSKYGETFDAENRVMLITEEQASSFYLFKAVKINGDPWRLERIPDELVVVRTTKEGDKVIMRYDGTWFADAVGTDYHIDEAWRFWGARDWQRTGEGVIFFNAQHAKWGHEVFIQAQHTSQIEKSIRVLAQDFWHCRNRSYLRLGVFRQPKDIKVAVFETAPESGRTQEPLFEKKLPIDFKGLGQCYDTTGGVGIGARLQGDSGIKRKGLPWWLIWVAGIGVVVLAWFLIKVCMALLMQKGIDSMFGSTKQHSAGVHAVTNSVSSDMSHSLANMFVPTLSSSSAKLSGSVEKAVDLPPVVKMTGYIWLPGGKLRVMTSDGRTYRNGDGHLQFVCEDFAVIDGKTNWTATLVQPLPDRRAAGYRSSNAWGL